MIITLLTDLGTSDAALPMARAMLMEHAPGADIVDVSHHAAHYDLRQAAYLLLSAYKAFPKGTVHIAAVDVFAGEEPCAIVIEQDGHYLIAPDNGLLALALGDAIADARLCFALSKPYSFPTWMDDAGDIVQSIFENKGIAGFPACTPYKARKLLQPQVMPHSIDCYVLFIDRYHNVVLDITKAQFEDVVKGRPFTINTLRSDSITTISSNYNDVAEGKPLCRFNDAGYLEIAVNHGDAAALLGLDALKPGGLAYQAVRIFH